MSTNAPSVYTLNLGNIKNLSKGKLTNAKRDFLDKVNSMSQDELKSLVVAPRTQACVMYDTDSPLLTQKGFKLDENTIFELGSLGLDNPNTAFECLVESTPSFFQFIISNCNEGNRDQTKNRVDGFKSVFTNGHIIDFHPNPIVISYQLSANGELLIVVYDGQHRSEGYSISTLSKIKYICKFGVHHTHRKVHDLASPTNTKRVLDDSEKIGNNDVTMTASKYKETIPMVYDVLTNFLTTSNLPRQTVSDNVKLCVDDVDHFVFRMLDYQDFFRNSTIDKRFYNGALAFMLSTKVASREFVTNRIFDYILPSIDKSNPEYQTIRARKSALRFLQRFAQLPHSSDQCASKFYRMRYANILSDVINLRDIMIFDGELVNSSNSPLSLTDVINSVKSNKQDAVKIRSIFQSGYDTIADNLTANKFFV
jgi:hypothetical protein